MKCIKLNKHICINKEINMHRLTKFFFPFLSLHQQRVEDNQTIKMYITFMKRRDVKLAPPVYMHYMETDD